jgi:hypothetical protein
VTEAVAHDSAVCVCWRFVLFGCVGSILDDDLACCVLRRQSSRVTPISTLFT